MKLSIRILSLLLVFSILLSSIACVSNNPDSDSETSQINSTSEQETVAPEETTNSHRDSGLPSKDYEGKTFTMLGASDFNSYYGDQRDLVYLEDVQTNSINEAIRDRNNYVSDTYGVTIKGILSDESVSNRITKSNDSDIFLCNYFTSSLESFAKLTDGNYVKDLNTFSAYLDLSNSCWSQECREQMSICKHLFLISGDIMTTDKESTWAIAFNRDLINDNHLSNPYDLVFSKKWTLENMYTMAATICDYSSHEPTDFFGTTWGLDSELSNSYFLWQGSGNSIITKDPETDRPIVKQLTENSYDALQWIAKLQYDSNTTILANNISGVDDVYDARVRIFKEGHALFFMGSISVLEWMRENDTDLGILPLPKYNEEQSSYYSSMSQGWTLVLGIPSIVGKTQSGDIDQNEIDFTAIIIQALAVESTDTLLEAYYDKTLVYKGLRREEDKTSLDYVYKGRIFDLSLVYTWADTLLADIRGAKSEKKIKNIKNRFDSYSNNITKAINDFIDKHNLD